MTTTQPTEFRNGVRMLLIDEDTIGLWYEGRPSCVFTFDSPEQAHRAALAILTGPGKVDVTDQSDPSTIHLRDSVRALNQNFEYIAARAAADAEAAELDRRAKVAYDARREVLHQIGAPWDDAPTGLRNAWRAVIRAIDADAEARRLHTNKEAK